LVLVFGFFLELDDLSAELLGFPVLNLWPHIAVGDEASPGKFLLQQSHNVWQ
jgi:hypothetical protein